MQNYGVIPPELQSRGSPNSELITLAAQRMSDRKDGNGFNRGTVVSVRGSVIDAQFPQGLPQLYSQLQAGEDGEVAIRLGVIIFGSDQGMCGQFNEQIAHYAVEQMNQLSIPAKNRTILAVGARVISPLEDAKISITSSFAMPSSLAGITPMVQELLLQIEAWRSQQQINRIILFYNQPRSNTSYIPHTLHLLPIDRAWLSKLQQQPWESRTLPTFTMDWSRLFSGLISQYFFVSLYRAFAESLASENASRLAAMQVSEQNIDERLAEFNAQFQHLRQTAITEEILEIVAGSEALSKEF